MIYRQLNGIMMLSYTMFKSSRLARSEFQGKASYCYAGCYLILNILILLLLVNLDSSFFNPSNLNIPFPENQVVLAQPDLAEESTTDEKNFLTYENSTYGLRIKYPADWDYYGSEELGGFQNIAVFQSPLEGRTDLYPALVSVSTDTLGKNQSLEEYVDELIPVLSESMSIIESKIDDNISLAGRPAYQIISNYTQDGINFEKLEMGVVVDYKAYVVAYNAEEAEYPKHLSIAQEMINSFEVMGISDTITSNSEAISGTVTMNGVNTTNATAADTNNANTLLAEADGLLFSGRYEEAMQYYDQVLVIDPNEINALKHKASALYGLGRYEEAITYYDKALSIEPNDVDTLLNKAVALDNLGRYEEAMQYYDKALVIEPNDFYALIDKGLALEDLGRYEEAIQYYDRLLDIDPNDVSVLNLKGNALSNLGRHEEAIQYYDKALAIAPDFVDALNNKANALVNLVEADGGVSPISNSTRVNDDDDYEILKTYTTYLIVYDNKMSSLVSTSASVNTNIQIYNEAIALYDKALSITPNDPDILTNKGKVLVLLGNYQESIELFDKVLSINVDHVGALYNKGEALKKLGETIEAQEYYDKALQLDPTYAGELINKVELVTESSAI